MRSASASRRPTPPCMSATSPCRGATSITWRRWPTSPHRNRLGVTVNNELHDLNQLPAALDRARSGCSARAGRTPHDNAGRHLRQATARDMAAQSLPRAHRRQSRDTADYGWQACRLVAPRTQANSEETHRQPHGAAGILAPDFAATVQQIAILLVRSWPCLAGRPSIEHHLLRRQSWRYTPKRGASWGRTV